MPTSVSARSSVSLRPRRTRSHSSGASSSLMDTDSQALSNGVEQPAAPLGLAGLGEKALVVEVTLGPRARRLHRAEHRLPGALGGRDGHFGKEGGVHASLMGVT